MGTASMFDVNGLGGGEGTMRETERFNEAFPVAEAVVVYSLSFPASPPDFVAIVVGRRI
jgi:hypothetical protein